MSSTRRSAVWLALLVLAPRARAGYVNFEASHVHPVAVAGSRLVAVNTPDARLEVFAIDGSGGLGRLASIPVGIEPVSVVVRTASEVWVANHLSDTVTIVDLDLGTAVRTLEVGDEPTDIAFAAGRALLATTGPPAGVGRFALTGSRIGGTQP